MPNAPMQRYAFPYLVAAIFAQPALAQEFPVWERACTAEHGLWFPVVLDWMTHVYPNETEKWGGMDMDMEAGAPESAR